ncbi:transporter, basic amino acid/polyamine antiporter (APA) family [Marinitoga piezophila KA3]|uniref:Transporter, basic amino acid/polyamine antiporter (APA) family n=1 Tax=Marinitoga piezophila (strain DSM 14283 / JCM 11233 / KA3) TaxID=443254 RepID=H2J546_MARPK|nr:basic amino acid/polyamine antiporter [Marinitoga piezophila]AEX86063.1 transporter, basic amino acid/polyamine antiporter (APA) family [Marinitoga piezophila KA3]
MSNNKVLGLFALTMLVIGSMIGAGIFNSPADLGSVANPGAILIGWLITGFGVFSLAMVFQFLSYKRPELEGGIYSYAREQFGEFIGFNSAWGYWWSALLGNIAFFAVIMKILSGYFPILEQNKIIALVFSSIILWVYHFLIVSGIRTAGTTNAILTVLKLIPLFLVAIVSIFAFNPDLVKDIFFSTKIAATGETASIFKQVNDSFGTMLWAFIGIEGAVVLSNKAKSQKDVGKATIIGFIITLIVYISVSVFTMGVVPPGELVNSTSPLGTVLSKVMGKPGQYILDFGFLFSVFGALLSWLLLTAEIPYIAAVKDNVFPKKFAQQNENATPVFSLTITNIITQIFLLSLLSDTLQNVYNTIFYIATTTILLPYFFSAVFGVKVAKEENSGLYKFFAWVAVIYTAWVIYAVGWIYIITALVIYSFGIFAYPIAKKERGEGLTGGQKLTYGVMWVISIVVIFLVATGKLSV